MALDNFRKINITLNKANQHVLEPQIAKVGDVNGRELVVQLIDGGVIKDQTGVSLKLNWQHANGNQGSENFKALDASRGIFSVYYPENMLYRGTVTANISINESGKITNSLNFQIAVKGDVFYGSAVEVDGILFTLKDLKNQLDERDENLENLENRQDSIENQFDDIQQEMADKDVISAPEIIAARNGEANLKDRLDKEQQEVTEKLAQTASDYVNVNSTKVFKYFAHRGITASYPENTIPAIRESARLGFYGVEFDVSETADGKFVLMHDKTVDRTTTGTGITKELTLSQIKDIDIDDVYFPNLKVPTLKEALLVCKQLGLMPLLDLTYINFNNESYQGIVDILKETGMEYNAIIQEGFISVLKGFRSISDVYLLYSADVTIADIDTIKGIGRCGGTILPRLTNYDIPSEVVEYATINDIPILSFTGEHDGLVQDAINKNLVGAITDNIRRW